MVRDQDWLRPSVFRAIGEPTPWVGCVSSGLRCPRRRVPTLKARPQSLNIADRSRVGGHRHGLLIDGHFKVLKSVRPLNRIMHWPLFLFFGIGKRRGRRMYQQTSSQSGVFLVATSSWPARTRATYAFVSTNSSTTNRTIFVSAKIKYRKG